MVVDNPDFEGVEVERVEVVGEPLEEEHLDGILQLVQDLARCRGHIPSVMGTGLNQGKARTSRTYHQGREGIAKPSPLRSPFAACEGGTGKLEVDRKPFQRRMARRIARIECHSRKTDQPFIPQLLQGLLQSLRPTLLSSTLSGLAFLPLLSLIRSLHAAWDLREARSPVQRGVVGGCVLSGGWRGWG